MPGTVVGIIIELPGDNDPFGGDTEGSSFPEHRGKDCVNMRVVGKTLSRSVTNNVDAVACCYVWSAFLALVLPEVDEQLEKKASNGMMEELQESLAKL